MTAPKQQRTTVDGAGFYIARRLPFVAGNGSLTGRHVEDVPPRRTLPTHLYAMLADACATSTAVYVVTSRGTPIAWSVNGAAFTVPDVLWPFSQASHARLVRRAAAIELVSV